MTRKENHKNRSVICVLVLLAISLPSFVATGQSLDAQRIYDRMVSVYATAQTYQDRVTVTDVLFKPDGKQVLSTTERVGTIAFDQHTNRFRFDYQAGKPSFLDPGDQYIVGSDGRSVKTWWTEYNSIDSRSSLGEALEGATSVSRGLTKDLPGLVMQDSVRVGWSLGVMTNLQYLGMEKLNGKLCYQISGIDQSGKQLVLWIDQSSGTLQGIDKGKNRLSSAYPGLTTLRFAPVLNQPIAAQDVAFNIPSIYWYWFRLSISALLGIVPAVLIALIVNWLYNRLRKRVLTI
jgi:hypothetical protein